MKRHRLLSALAAIAVFGSASVALAQTPPQQDETQPKAASSPHQRESTSTEAKEAPAGTDTSPSAASTPHQQEATHGKVATGKTKAEREQMMNDCMKKEQARDSSMSAEQVKKTCTDQMKKMQHGTTTQQPDRSTQPDRSRQQQ